MQLVFLHGPAAAGKLTVARALAARTGYALFHNHLVVDAVAAVFPFGSPEFRRLRERFWLETFDAAAREGRSLVFTFAPEATVGPTFPQEARACVERHGGRVRFIALTCPPEELARRVDNADRATFGKLRDADLFRRLAADGAFDYPPIASELTIDTSALAPDTAAERIARRLQA
ncbi:AAA family ATPase [Phenylobacterium sp.]|uniref:AAA family ATPase n=1 Tax=Phenylobacterium sp. TaxID=1871053 RepID=UPI002EDAE0F7